MVVLTVKSGLIVRSVLIWLSSGLGKESFVDKLTALLIESVVVRMCEVNLLVGKKLGSGQITEEKAAEAIQESHTIFRDMMNSLSE